MIGKWFLIHAAKGMTKAEFDSACEFAIQAGAMMLPHFDELHRGGIVGMARLTDCVRSSKSKWFVGRFGFVLTGAYPLPFEPCTGTTGFFERGEFQVPDWATADHQ